VLPADDAATHAHGHRLWQSIGPRRSGRMVAIVGDTRRQGLVTEDGAGVVQPVGHRGPVDRRGVVRHLHLGPTHPQGARADDLEGDGMGEPWAAEEEDRERVGEMRGRRPLWEDSIRTRRGARPRPRPSSSGCRHRKSGGWAVSGPAKRIG
jgi:hypothetical protein